jgi:hypothetical protein
MGSAFVDFKRFYYSYLKFELRDTKFLEDRHFSRTMCSRACMTIGTGTTITYFVLLLGNIYHRKYWHYIAFKQYLEYSSGLI